MSNLTPVIDSINGLTRRIYLKQGVVDYFPMEDIYHEYRTLRRIDESLRHWAPLLLAEGNKKKGGGAFTPRYVVLLDGTKIIPFDEPDQLNQLGDMITDDPDTDPTLYDISGLTTAKPIFIKPSESEIIQLNNEAIVFSSFQGSIWIDTVNGYTDKGSAVLPNGNTERPVKTMALALEIAVERGIKNITLISSSLTINEDMSAGYKLIGTSPFNVVTINNIANVTGLAVENVTVTGELDGLNLIKHSGIQTITDVSGIIETSSIDASISLNGDIRIADCYSNVAGGGYPSINAIAGTVIQIRDFKGSIGINGVVDSVHSIGGEEGRVVIGADCIGGTIHIRGDWFEIIDNSGVGCTVLDERSVGGLDETGIHDSLDSYINKDDYKADVSNLSADVNVIEVQGVAVTDIDDFKATTTISSNMRGTDGANTVIPDNTNIALIKTKVDTLNNYDDTGINSKLDSILYGLSTMQLSIDALQDDIDVLLTDNIYIGAQVDNIFDYVKHQDRCVFVNEELVPVGDGTGTTPFNSINNAVDYAELNGIRCIKLLSDATVTRNLKNFIIAGIGTHVLDCNGQNLDGSEFTHLIMRGTYTGQIIVQECVLDDGFRLNGFFDKNAVNGDLVCIGDVLFSNNFSNIAGLSKPSISVDGHKVSIRNWSGGILIKDCDSAISEITVEVNQGKIYLENTCIDGLISCRGNATLDDQSGPGCTVDITALINQELAERTARASHKIEGTQLVIYDDRGEIGRWNLSDINSNPSSENVFFRTKV